MFVRAFRVLSDGIFLFEVFKKNIFQGDSELTL